MRVLLSDYDHENERHVIIAVARDLSVHVSRFIETNADYLKRGAALPEDWSSDETLRFADAATLREFVTLYSSELLQACFRYFHDSSEVDSDEARGLIAKSLAGAPLSGETKSGVRQDELQSIVKRLRSFPR